MRFKKLGKALCMGALSAGIVFGVSSCIRSYAVGYLYVTGTVTAQTGNNGIITGYVIDHNTGNLTLIHNMPIAAGGANPVRAVLIQGSRFFYVLNRGVSASGDGNCYGTGANQCTNANITEFAVGGNGIMTQQETFYTQGINPFRLIADTTGAYLLALDHDSPDNANPSSTDGCARALGNLGGTTPVTTCGDVTVFKVDQTTGRLSLVTNAQVTAASGQPLNYFPVPPNPVDFVIVGGEVITLTGAPAPTSYPYTGGTEVWPYAENSSTGQLTLSQNSIQPLVASAGPMKQGTSLVIASSVVYVMDNEPITVTFNGQSTTSPSQILPFTVGTNGALQTEPTGIIPDDTTLSNPIQVLVEAKGKFVYVANQGNNVSGPNPQSGIAGYFLTNVPAYQLSFIAGEPWGSGSGPQCIVEDPSNQFIYEANLYDSTVTGRVLDPNSGQLNAMRVNSTFKLNGPATWCLMNGRTD